VRTLGTPPAVTSVTVTVQVRRHPFVKPKHSRVDMAPQALAKPMISRGSEPFGPDMKKARPSGRALSMYLV